MTTPGLGDDQAGGGVGTQSPPDAGVRAEPAYDVTPGPRRRARRPQRLPALAAVLAVAVAAVAVVTVLVALRLRAADREDAARRDATNAAVAALPKIASYDYRHLAADKDRALSVLTPALARDYTKLFLPLDSLVQQRKPIVTAAVRAAQAIDTQGDGRARILVFFDQQTASADAAAPVLKPNAFQLTMEREGDGRWLVAALDPADQASAVPQPTPSGP